MTNKKTTKAMDTVRTARAILGAQLIPSFQTVYNFRFNPRHKEKDFSPSLTVPDEALSIPHLMRNHVRDLPTLGRDKHPLFLGDDYINPDDLDLIDKEDMLHQVKSQINATQTEFLHKQKQDPPELLSDKKKAAGGHGSASPGSDKPAQSDPGEQAS